jgi:diamine N-acetyltransferase
MVQLSVVIEKDLAEISQLAQLIWYEHYIPIIGQLQVDYMLNKMYNLDSLVEQLNEKKHIFYFIEFNHEKIGFISVNEISGKDFFINKFYIHQQKANSGIGSNALNILIDLINPKTLKLTVNRQNFKSINFYFKNGFKIHSVEDFDIGNGYVMNDFVMIKKIN